jgi:uncharacterized protein YaaW (UPF0174 family)
MTTLSDKINAWSKEDRANIATLLELDSSTSVIAIQDSIKWLYHSRTRQSVKDKIGFAAKKMKLGSKENTLLEEYEAPSWEELVVSFCKNLEVHSDDFTQEQLEEYCCHAVITQALVAMPPESRATFFNSPVNLDEIVQSANIKNPSLKGPQTALAVMSAVQLSGFSLYIASTTALGFASGALGITLPFAAYTGLTATLSYVTGPLGFTAAAIWGAWKITGPEWKKLAPIILYIISHDARMKIS